MKATGNYASLVRGVSQQAPADRLDGQHGEQINMIADPIRGLVRRNGMVIEHQTLTAATGNPSDAIADSQSFRTFSMRIGGREMDMMYRTRTKVGATANNLSGIIVYDKTPDASAGFIPLVTDVADTAVTTYLDNGFSAVASLGAFVLLAGNAVAPSYTTDDQMVGKAWSKTGVAWVRGGAYARTYKLTAVKASTGVSYSVTYTTKTAAYNGTLDTSAILTSDPDYQKKVNDLTYTYNSNVNKWISDASADIVPANIAQKLADAMTAAGFTGWYVSGSHLAHDDLSFMEVTDGGDGTLFISLLSTTGAVDEVTDMHMIGKVVKVQPKEAGDEAFFLKASAKDGNPAATGLRPVLWRECAGVTQTPTGIFAIGTRHLGNFYLASTGAKLAALILATSGDTVAVPGLVASAVGDTTSAKPPSFYGKRITAMGVFQDRLMLISGSTANLSRPGDYFNFYRSSVLTVLDDDPIEVYAVGTEDDTIRQLALYDKSMMLYGDKYHYAINGKVPLTPQTAALAVQYTVANTAGARPVGAGHLVFCMQEDVNLAASRVLQTQAGLFEDAPQLTDASRQLRDYINGTPAEMVSITNPSILFVRTEPFLKSTGAFPRARPSGLYVYQYLDDEGGRRLQDAWWAWEWSMSLGTPIGLAPVATSNGLMVYTLAWGKNEVGANTRAVIAMSVSTRADPTGLPYLDGMRKAEDAAANGLFTTGAVADVRAITCTAAGSAYSNVAPAMGDALRFAGLRDPNYTLGDAPAEYADPYRWTGVYGHLADYTALYPHGNTGDLWTGVVMPAFVDLTNPFVRDIKGKAKTWGRLTLSRLRATLIRSAGFEATWIDHTGVRRTQHLPGRYERIKYGLNIWIGRDTREVQVRLAALDWLPLTINALEWAGQWFDASGKQH